MEENEENERNELLINHPAYKKARDAYGIKYEFDQLQEECAELIQAVSKVKRCFDDEITEERTKAISNFFEEMGDVENMIQQMKHWFIAADVLIPEWRIHKLTALEEHIDSRMRR